MVSFHQSTTGNAFAAHGYNFKGPAHDGSGQRVVYEAGVECTPHSWLRTLFRARADHGKQHLKVEALHSFLSYSDDEADRDDADAGLMVLDDACGFAERAFSGHASAISVQKDGRAGLWHAHIVTANVGHGPSRLYDGTVRPAGYALHESQRHVFTSRNILDEMLLERRGFDNVAHMEAHSGSDHTISSDEAKREKGAYVWRDDLKARINEHAAKAADFADFTERMAADGVVVTEKGTQKRGLAYEFAGQDGKPHRARAGGRQGLGTAYGYEEIVARLGQPVADRHGGVEQAPAPPPAPESVVEREEMSEPAPPSPLARGNRVWEAFVRGVESTPVAAHRASGPDPEPVVEGVEPEHVVEEPVVSPGTGLAAEELARRRRRVQQIEEDIADEQAKLAEYDRYTQLNERANVREAYRRRWFRILVRRMVLETLRRALLDAELSWQDQPSPAQRDKARKLADEFTREWLEQVAMTGTSSVKRPAAGHQDWQGPKPQQ